MNLGGLALSNPAGLWALLALPALVAVHFFQQRSRRVETSTRFLVDALAPESQGGRTWERFRASRVFWLQALAVLLAAWVLVAPRWPRADSTQTVVLVLDDAIAMQAVAEEARTAATRLMMIEESGAARSEWVVMGSNPRSPILYRGRERSLAETAVGAWRPSLGTHDYAPALRQGRSLASSSGAGVCWLVTDRAEKVPPDQAAVGVGRFVANVGFAGGAVRREGASWSWKALVKNSSGEAVAREWWIETAAGASERRRVELPEDGVVELGGAWPEGAERAILRVASDGFGADDALPLLRPEWKRLRARVSLGGEAGEFFHRLLASVDGVEASAALSAELRVVEEAGGGGTSSGPAVVLAASASEKTTALVRAPVVAERHPLVEGLNWQGLLGPGPAGLRMGETDEGLLWQDDKALVWLRPGAEGRRQLVLNLDWAAGNAARLPATVLLLRRYIEAAREALPGAYAANFDANGLVAIAEVERAKEPTAEWSVEIEGGERRVAPREELAVLRAPAEAGFFTVRRGVDVLVRGSAHFADARQADFRGASNFRRDPPSGEREAAMRRNTQGDPLAQAWLALAGAALLGSWWSGRRRA